MSWELWAVKLMLILDECRRNKKSTKEMWDKVRPAIYCQSGTRLTLDKENYHAIHEWVIDYFTGLEPPFPLSGEIPDADFHFEIDYNADAKLVDNLNLNSPAAMSEFNKETNAVRNVQKGKEKVLRRFQAAFPNCKLDD